METSLLNFQLGLLQVTKHEDFFFSNGEIGALEYNIHHITSSDPAEYTEPMELVLYN